MSKQERQDVSFSIVGFFSILWKNIYLIAIITIVSAVLAVIYVKNMPDVYKAEVVMTPASGDDTSNLSGLSGQLGGLASLSGINLGSSGNNKVAEFIALSKSRNFVQNFIKKYQILPQLMAATSWNKTTNTLTYDTTIYNNATKSWLVKKDKKLPTTWNGYDKFLSLITVLDDSGSGLVKMSLNFYDPHLAKQWLSLFITELNDAIRQDDISDAQNSIDYLSKQAELSELQSVKRVFYNLIEQKTKTLLLAKVNKSYVLKPLGGIALPEEKDSPKRSLIVILVTFVAFLIAVIFALFRHLLVIERLSTAPLRSEHDDVSE